MNERSALWPSIAAGTTCRSSASAAFTAAVTASASARPSLQNRWRTPHPTDGSSGAGMAPRLPTCPADPEVRRATPSVAEMRRGVVSLVVLAVLAACGGGDDADRVAAVSTTTSSSSTSSSTTTTTAPPPPPTTAAPAAAAPAPPATTAAPATSSPTTAPSTAPARSVPDQGWGIPFAAVGGMALVHPSSHVERIGFHESNHDGAQPMQPLASAVSPFVMESRDRGTAGTTAADIVVQPGTEIRAPDHGHRPARRELHALLRLRRRVRRHRPRRPADVGGQGPPHRRRAGPEGPAGRGRRDGPGPPRPPAPVRVPGRRDPRGGPGLAPHPHRGRRPEHPRPTEPGRRLQLAATEVTCRKPQGSGTLIRLTHGDRPPNGRC